MAPWAILYIYRARLRARLVLVQELLAILGIAVGVALLFASQVASTSLDGSIRQLSIGIVGRASLQLVARDPHSFEQRLLGRARSLPGVSGVEPVLEARATSSRSGKHRLACRFLSARFLFYENKLTYRRARFASISDS